jgi:hypothetical protein
VAIPSGIVGPHLGSIASIPAGASRFTDYDSKFVLGPTAGSGGGSDFGADSHTHPDPAQHRHAISGGASSGAYNAILGTSARASNPHTHGSSNSTYASPSVATKSNDPKHKEVIWIQYDGTIGLKTGGYAFFDSVPSDSDLKFGDGSSGTQDVRDFWLKGAAASSEIGAGLATGVEAHVHGMDHSHGAANSAATSNKTLIGGAGSIYAQNAHVHSVSLNTATVNSASANGATPWIKLGAYMNSGAEKDPDGMILIWPSTVGSIPTDWTRVSAANDRLVRCSDTTGNIGTTGGALSHLHGASSHSNHIPTAGTGTTGTGEFPPNTTTAATGGHTHVWTVGAASISLLETEDEMRPRCKTGIWIKYTAPAVSALRTRTMMGVGL